MEERMTLSEDHKVLTLETDAPGIPVGRYLYLRGLTWFQAVENKPLSEGRVTVILHNVPRVINRIR
jgi:hypothetical protein